VREHVLLVRPQGAVITGNHRVVGGSAGRRVRRERSPLGDPLVATAVQQADVLVAEQREDPQGVRRPPVVLVAVDHDGVFARDALGAQEGGEAPAVDVIAHHGVVELGVPVDLDRSGDVPGLVEQDVLIGFDDDEAGLIEPGLQPFAGDEPTGLGVLGELGG